MTEDEYRDGQVQAARMAGYTQETAEKIADDAVQRFRLMHKPWLRPVEVTGVWLLREGEYVKVLIERGGNYYEAISEHVEGNFSHNISAEGIRGLKEPVSWLNQES